jgi:16S rRNA G527 N7-methylase RsmG
MNFYMRNIFSLVSLPKTHKKESLFYALLLSMVNRTPLIHTFLEKNSQLNLSAFRDEESVALKHIQDSLEVNKVISFPKGTSVVDL